MSKCWSARPKLPTQAIPARPRPRAKKSTTCCARSRKLFPKAKISAHDIKYAFAGVRPLPNSPGKNASAVTRRHFLHDHTPDGAARLISVIGGKLTTAASLARECARKIGIAVPEPTMVAMGPGSALDPMLDQEALEIARAGSVSEETARGMMEWHGHRAMDVARMALVSAELRAPICPHTSHVVAEVVEAFRKRVCSHAGRRTVAPGSSSTGRVLVRILQPRGRVAHRRRAGLERADPGSESGIV